MPVALDGVMPAARSAGCHAFESNVDRLIAPRRDVVKTSTVISSSANGSSHGNVTLTGGYSSRCATTDEATVTGSGTRRSLSFLGRPYTSRDHTRFHLAADVEPAVV